MPLLLLFSPPSVIIPYQVDIPLSLSLCVCVCMGIYVCVPLWRSSHEWMDGWMDVYMAVLLFIQLHHRFLTAATAVAGKKKNSYNSPYYPWRDLVFFSFFFSLLLFLFFFFKVSRRTSIYFFCQSLVFRFWSGGMDE